MADCPACGAEPDFGDVLEACACPACDTPLAELHALALEGER
jgi:hypothetical protein